MPARMHLHLRRLRDYFASVSILSLYPLRMCVCVCACLLSCPSRLYVNVGRVDQHEEKKPEEKKVLLVRYCLVYYAFKKLGDWRVMRVLMCVVAVIEDRKALDEVKKRMERKPRQTCEARL